METWPQKPAHLCLRVKQAGSRRMKRRLSALLEQVDDVTWYSCTLLNAAPS